MEGNKVPKCEPVEKKGCYSHPFEKLYLCCTSLLAAFDFPLYVWIVFKMSTLEVAFKGVSCEA